jgi:hypothetical protein
MLVAQAADWYHIFPKDIKSRILEIVIRGEFKELGLREQLKLLYLWILQIENKMVKEITLWKHHC